MPSRPFRILPGMTVYDSAGRFVGEVIRVVMEEGQTAHTPQRPARGWVESSRDAMGAGRLYIPLDGIADVRGKRVYLKVREDQLEELGWTGPGPGKP